MLVFSVPHSIHYAGLRPARPASGALNTAAPLRSSAPPRSLRFLGRLVLVMIRFPVATLVMTVAAAAILSSQDWTQWRGPQGAAVASTFKPPVTWPDEPKLAWKAPGAGIGHASPVVSGTRVFLFSRVGEQEALTAYDLASGKQLWRQTYDAPYEMNPAARGHGKGPKGTPLFHGGRLFTFGI